MFFNPLLKNVKVDFNREEDIKGEILSNEMLKDKSKKSFLGEDLFDRQVRFDDTSFDNTSVHLSSVNVIESPIDDIKREGFRKSSSFFKKHKWFFIVFFGCCFKFGSFSWNIFFSKAQKAESQSQ